MNLGYNPHSFEECLAIMDIKTNNNEKKTITLIFIFFGQQTYVPDDNFEAWIETTIAADNGALSNFIK